MHSSVLKGLFIFVLSWKQSGLRDEWRETEQLWVEENEQEVSHLYKPRAETKRRQMCNVAHVEMMALLSESKRALQKDSQECGAAEEMWFRLLRASHEGQMLQKASSTKSSLRKSTDEESARPQLREKGDLQGAVGFKTLWQRERFDGSPKRMKVWRSSCLASTSTRRPAREVGNLLQHTEIQHLQEELFNLQVSWS